ncbi:hypothetical protein P8452_48486 [Trifolium repens]|nr:hypothetical protein P8452_48486 [Trifolium repens]
MIPLIENQSTNVCMVGIWGMGGLGKTTTAKAIYNQIHRKFVYRSFIENIGETCETGNRGQWHIHLQQQLLSDLLKTKEKIHSIASGTIAIKKILSAKKVLIVLDDVTKVEQVKALYGSRKWFGSGSVIIVTSRDKRILTSLQVDHVYTVAEMDPKESLELFCWHAFKKAGPRADFSELSRNVTTYCGGLPLAVEVIGSYLYDREIDEWTSVLSKLKVIPDQEVHEKLRISYDGLRDGKEKDIFLDICCFFIGKDITYVTEILNGCDLFPGIGIPVLIERSLLKVDKNNKLGMHDLIRNMGREIVRQNSEKDARLILEKDPGECSRLWLQKDVLGVLTNNTGTQTVEGLILNLERTSRVSFNTSAFQEMKKLRLLQLDCVDLTGDFGFLSKQLRWVNWQQSTFNCIPNNFYQGNVVVFELKYSMVKQVWKEAQLLDKLKILNLSHSKLLKTTPNFSLLPSLEKLIMKDCPSLTKVHPSIGDLKNLLLINFKDCTSLGNLPREIYQLTSVTTLILSGCSNINKFDEDIVQMKSLRTLIAAKTGVKQAPFSIVRLKSIMYISLCGYEGLSCDVFPSLIWSWMSPTMNSLPHSPHISLDVESNNLGLGYQLPMARSCSTFRGVWIQCSSEIQLNEELKRLVNDLNSVDFSESETSHASQISDLSLKSLWITLGSKSLSQGLTTSGSGDCFLPVDNYPSGSSFYTCTGPSVHFRVPEDSDCCMKGITLCVVSENMSSECLVGVLIINYTKLTMDIYKQDTVMSFNDEDWQDVKSNLGAGDNVGIFVVLGHGFTVKETAVYLIHGQSSTMGIESSITMEVEKSIMVKMEPLPEVELQTPPNVKIEPSSPEDEVRPSHIVQQPNKSIFVNFAKRVCKCACLKPE